MNLYNSLTQQKEAFKTLEKNKVNLYVCGITPYDTTHLGHAFLYIFFDVLRRYLTFKGYDVNYVQNITDIDDDILRKANEQKRDWQELGKFWTDKFLADLKDLNIQMPNHYVKATDSIPTIIKIIQDLLEKGFAYEKEGTIFFRTAKDSEYGKLSHFNRQQMLLLSKERGANPDDPRKEDPLDFILWQKSLQNEPGWDSDWGKGRPGWHIECSAMNYEYLGAQIDIHGGGRDLIYPHHESEIAQSESYTEKKPFSKYWMHAAMLMYQGEKMSKSLGNLVMVSDLLKEYSPNAIRWLLLSHHYRTPWEYSKEELKQAEQNIAQIQTAINKNITPDKPEKSLKNNFLSDFQTAMDDDANTTQALEIIQQLTRTINADAKVSSDMQTTLKILYSTLGFTIN